MMGIVLSETCWACNKICNKYHLLHLVGVLFPHSISGSYRVCVIRVVTGSKLLNILEADVPLLSYERQRERGTAYPSGICSSTREATQDIACPAVARVLVHTCCSTPQKWNSNEIWRGRKGMKVTVFWHVIICSGGERTDAWYTLTMEVTWTPETSVHFYHSTRSDTSKYRFFFQEFKVLNHHGDEGSTN